MELRGQEHAGETGVGSFSGNGASSTGAQASNEAPRYQECLRNHAAAQGGHAVDGCGEFMPPGDDGGSGTDALRCAACGCHRSFHRKDDGQQHYQYRHFPLLPAPTPRVPLLMPPPHPYAASHPHAAPAPAPPHFPFNHQHHQHRHTPSGGTTTESSSEERAPGPPSTSPQGEARRKRFRTRFTAEQKEQMLALAERVGWRMQKQDDALVEHFCALAGVRRQVFKVWMHNNKHHHGRRQQQEQHSQQPQQ
jgi:ZF-HD class homeobox domain-containing protein